MLETWLDCIKFLQKDWGLQTKGLEEIWKVSRTFIKAEEIVRWY